MKIAKKMISMIINTLLVLALSLTFIVVIVSKTSGKEPIVFGYELKTVLSGSMEPAFKTGSIIAVKPVEDKTRLKKNDVITFMEEDGKFITHRILEVIKTSDSVMYRTKGDNNKSPDMKPVLAENVVGKYDGFTLPYAGYIVNFAQSKNGAFLLLIPGIILLCYSGFTIWQAWRELDLSDKNKSENETQSA